MSDEVAPAEPGEGRRQVETRWYVITGSVLLVVGVLQVADGRPGGYLAAVGGTALLVVTAWRARGRRRALRRDAHRGRAEGAR